MTALIVALAACSSSGDPRAEFCDRLAELRAFDASTSATELNNPVAVQADLEEFARRFEDLEATSPDEIRDQVAIVARFGRNLAEAAVASQQADSFDRATALATASADEPEVADALDQLRAWETRNCTAAP